MLSINEGRKLLGLKYKNCSDEELKAIIGFVHELAELVVNDIKKEEHEKSSVNVTRVK